MNFKYTFFSKTTKLLQAKDLANFDRDGLLQSRDDAFFWLDVADPDTSSLSHLAKVSILFFIPFKRARIEISCPSSYARGYRNGRTKRKM